MAPDSFLSAQAGDPPLDVYEKYIDYQLSKAIHFYDITKNLLRSFRLLQVFRPKSIEFVDTGLYDPCSVHVGKPCNCSLKSSASPVESHWAGNPTSVDVALRIPVSNLSEWLYNRGRFYCWKWTLRVMTDRSFLTEANKRPDVYYDMFTYPVNTEYLTPETTKAAVYRWLKLSCPKLNYNMTLTSRDVGCLPRRA